MRRPLDTSIVVRSNRQTTHCGPTEVLDQAFTLWFWGALWIEIQESSSKDVYTWPLDRPALAL